MIHKKTLTSLITISVISSLFMACSPIKEVPSTKIIEKSVTVDYEGSPEQILLSYSQDGIKKMKNLYPDQVARDYALKQIGKVAPDFELINTKGEKIKLSTFKGRKVILDFSKSTCSSCKESEASLNKAIKANTDITYISIFPKDNKTDIIAYYNSLKLEPNPIVISGVENATSTLIKDYNLTSIPTLIYIDETGKISYTFVGSFDEILLNDFSKTAYGSSKLYNMLIKEKIEIDKNGKEVNPVKAKMSTTDGIYVPIMGAETSATTK